MIRIILIYLIYFKIVGAVTWFVTFGFLHLETETFQGDVGPTFPAYWVIEFSSTVFEKLLFVNGSKYVFAPMALSRMRRIVF